MIFSSINPTTKLLCMNIPYFWQYSNLMAFKYLWIPISKKVGISPKPMPTFCCFADACQQANYSFLHPVHFSFQAVILGAWEGCEELFLSVSVSLVECTSWVSSLSHGCLFELCMYLVDKKSQISSNSDRLGWHSTYTLQTQWGVTLRNTKKDICLVFHYLCFCGK